MATVRLRNVDPSGDIEFPLIGRGYDNPLKAGEEFEVDEDVAGELGGIWREPTEAEREEAASNGYYVGLQTREAGEAPNIRTEVLSPGRGLLSTGKFEIVKSSKTSKPNTTITTSTEA